MGEKTLEFTICIKNDPFLKRQNDQISNSQFLTPLIY